MCKMLLTKLSMLAIVLMSWRCLWRPCWQCCSSICQAYDRFSTEETVSCTPIALRKNHKKSSSVQKSNSFSVSDHTNCTGLARLAKTYLSLVSGTNVKYIHPQCPHFICIIALYQLSHLVYASIRVWNSITNSSHIT